ncbi:hypothetical protein JIN85_16655 [Luteolibacter pohnpeiensis]|uniref:Uncharacterized protein n=1 Tax=Luteolibacter pohnpeiensis TaxID=454153 RepID=A0A934SDC7_9BACT|nr:hypothetical protein [Luteolibacter pohnpeiensis]MBK1884052.1 hypothetical protein [Luteolibacter pohnpeiensis]
MKHLLGNSSYRQEVRRLIPRLLAFVIVLAGGLGLLIFWNLPRMKKIGEVRIDGVGRLEMASQQDGDISTNVFYRLIRNGNPMPEWTHTGWTLGKIEPCIYANTPDGRFFCIASQGEVHLDRYTGSPSLPLMIIYDRKNDVVWPAEPSKNLPEYHWDNAWKSLKAANPALPDPAI